MGRFRRGRRHFLPAVVLELPTVYDGLARTHVEDAPEGLSFAGFPDERLDGLARVERPRAPAGHARRAPGLAGDETFQKRPVGKAEGAQAVHDGLLEARGLRKVGVHVKSEKIARQAVQKRLIG